MTHDDQRFSTTHALHAIQRAREMLEGASRDGIAPPPWMPGEEEQHARLIEQLQQAANRVAESASLLRRALAAIIVEQDDHSPPAGRWESLIAEITEFAP